MASIAFEGVSKVFPDGTKAVDGLDLCVADGEFTILVGPSGSGKSTALRMVAGLEETSGGSISIGERVVNDVAPKDRDIAMVFQSYALYPHMSVEANMGFALKLAKEDSGAIRTRVGRAATRLGIGELLERRPKALSGGQRQRGAVGGGGGRGARAPPAGFPEGGAVVEPRREAAGGDAGLHRPPAPGARDDNALRHPRPNRGHDHGRPRRGHARRPAGAVRHARAALSAPRQRVRRGVHRLTRHEPAARRR